MNDPVVLLAIAAVVAAAIWLASRPSRRRAGQRRETQLSVFLDRRDVLILDTETTGLGRDAEILEIAIIDTTGRTRYSAPVMPEGRIPREASDVHGLTRAALRELRALPALARSP